jgi:outer membrane protein TolC
LAQQAQQPSPITLPQAVKIALESNPQRKAALADTKAASADVKEARSFLLPRITFSEMATRGNGTAKQTGNNLARAD